MTSRLPLTDGIASAVRFLGTAWRQAWAAMLVSGVVLGAFWALRLWSPHSPWRAAALAVAALTTLMAEGGLYRLALRAGGKPGPGGLQWGRLEWRLCAVWGLTGLFLFVLAMLASAAVLVLAFGVASSGHGFLVTAPSTWGPAVDQRGRLVLTLASVAALVGLLWAATRVSLGAAASVARERVQVLASWPDTRGIGLRIVAARVLLAIAPVGLTAAILVLASRLPGRTALVDWVSGLAAGGMIAGVWVPLSVALTAWFFSTAASAPRGRAPE
jgi:hypothetical protein